jgi:hypothetical protein
VVDIGISETSVTFRVAGIHKLWAVKSRIEVPLDGIVKVEGAEAVPAGLPGWRLPGTYFPGVITAGSYKSGSEWSFWDVVRPAKALVVTLRGHRYTRLVVEVPDPAADLWRLKTALAA